MASKGGNLFLELLDEPEPEPIVAQPSKKQEKKKEKKQEKKQEKKEKETEPAKGNKREFDRHVSGTGRGKEVSKDGHLAWGKVDDKKAIEAATAEALENDKTQFADPLEKKDDEAEKEVIKEETQAKKPKKEKKEQKEGEQEEKVKAEPPKQTLEQYLSQIDAKKIRLEHRTISKPNEMESEKSTKGYVVLSGTDKTKAKPKKTQPKKNTATKAPEKSEPVLTTADFFKRDKHAAPPPRREFNRRPRFEGDKERAPRGGDRERERERDRSAPTVYNVWRRVGDHHETFTEVKENPTAKPGTPAVQLAPIKAPAAAAAAAAPAAAPAAPKADASFPSLNVKKPKAPKEKAAAPAAEQKAAAAAAPAKN